MRKTEIQATIFFEHLRRKLLNYRGYYCRLFFGRHIDGSARSALLADALSRSHVIVKDVVGDIATD